MREDQATRNDAERGVSAIAAGQRGLVTRAQAIQAGLTPSEVKSRVARGRWERLLPGVYRIAGAPATGRQGMLAATLWGGRRSVLSFRAAGVLWGLDRVRAPRLEITIEAPRRLQHDAVIVHRTGELPRLDRAVEDGIRVTSVARTLVDLAGVLETNSLEFPLEDALRRKLTTRDEILARVDALGGSGRVGGGRLRSLLGSGEDAGRPSGSPPEIELRRLLIRAGLPEPVGQHAVRAGTFTAFLDLAYPELMIGIEYDGERWHSGRVARQRDLRRDHALAALGWLVLHVTSSEIRDGVPTVVRAVRAAITRSSSFPGA